MNPDQHPRFDHTKWLSEVRSLEMICKVTKGDIKQEARIYSHKYPLGADGYSSVWVDGPHCIPEALSSEKQQLTVLYSIRAHRRSRLHMKVRKTLKRDGTVERREWTLEDQAKLIEGYEDTFVLKDAQPEQAA